MAMRKTVQIRITILALMLAVSHVALISHVTAHFEPELEPCELCVSQAELLSAIPSSDHGVAIDTRFGLTNFENHQCLPPTRRNFTFQQRAPPATSA
jgi:hypothetical protein